MSNIYIHKSLFGSKQFSISNTGIDIKEKSAFNYNERSVDFNEFTIKLSVKKETNNGLLFFVFMFGIATVVLILNDITSPGKSFGSATVFLFLFLAFLSISLLTKKKVIKLPIYYSNNDLELPFKTSTEKEARIFAEMIISEAKKYLISKYTKIDKDLPKESQLENLLSLRDRDLIDETEFNRLKNILLNKENDSKIGFN